MSKKDYQAVAADIYKIRRFQVNVHEQTVAAIVAVLADTFKADNPRFDRARFVEACETGKTKGMKQADPYPEQTKAKTKLDAQRVPWR